MIESLLKDNTPPLIQLKTEQEKNKATEPDDTPFSLEIDDKRVICRDCMNHITHRDYMFKKDGSAVHLFENPSGIFFRIICFESAEGVVPVSDYSSEFTWFPGYKWCPVVCATCKKHLGWHYIGDRKFYGLIADKLSGI